MRAKLSSLASIPSIPLRDGRRLPLLGYGTYKVGFIPASASSQQNATNNSAENVSTSSSTVSIISNALLSGYRLLDCARFYGNEKSVGDAIRLSGIPRSELFLSGKVWNDAIETGPEAVKEQVYASLSDLQVTYLDLCLVHWPVPGKHVKAYKALIELQREGKIRSLGISNYTIEDYEELMAELTSEEKEVLPCVLQIEVNPFLHRKKTLDYFRRQGVQIQAYRSLRQGKELLHPSVLAVAQKHKKTAAQVLERWCIDQKIAIIPKSTKRSRMDENASIFDFKLDDDDFKKLDGLTTVSNLTEFEELYRKCIVRDTSIKLDRTREITIQ
eukprot:g4752.t1